MTNRKRLTWPDSSVPILKIKIKVFFQKIFFNLPFIDKVARKLSNAFKLISDLKNIEKKRRDGIALIRTDEKDSMSLGSNYGYKDEMGEFKVTLKYYEQINEPGFESSVSESYILYQSIVDKLSKLFSSDSSIKKFFNLGVSYGHIDYLLARKHPHIEFVGLDRSRFTRIFNEAHFSELSNLKFVSGDFFQYLKDRDFSCSVFFTARTLVYLPPSIIHKIYDTVCAKRFKYITLFEQVGLSMETLSPFIFDENERDSVLHREKFFIHNYPYYLETHGFVLNELELIKTNHPFPDFRILFALAKNTNS